MKITMIGAGYVGLVTGACFAEVGNDVLCVDVDAAKIATLEGGGVPIHEPGLAEMIARNVHAGRLRFTTDLGTAVTHGMLQFIAVGTPPDEDGSADMRHVIAAAENIATRMTEFKVIVDKSTVPVGTADRIRQTIADVLAQRDVDVPFAVASNPEFLKEGAAVQDFMRPDRVVIGADDERAIALLRTVYAPFQRNHERLLVMDVRSAELTKYAANAMLATRISFMNEMANLADALGADVEQVRQGIGSDPADRLRLPVPGRRLRWFRAFPRTSRRCRPPPRNMAAAAYPRRSRVGQPGAKTRLVTRSPRGSGTTCTATYSRCGGWRSSRHRRHARSAVARNCRGLSSAVRRVVAYDPIAIDEAKRVFGRTSGLTSRPRHWPPCRRRCSRRRHRMEGIPQSRVRGDSATHSDSLCCSMVVTCSIRRWCAALARVFRYRTPMTTPGRALCRFPDAIRALACLSSAT